MFRSLFFFFSFCLAAHRHAHRSGALVRYLAPNTCAVFKLTSTATLRRKNSGGRTKEKKKKSLNQTSSCSNIRGARHRPLPYLVRQESVNTSTTSGGSPEVRILEDIPAKESESKWGKKQKKQQKNRQENLPGGDEELRLCCR